jgi:type IV secretion/conjugal transfer VirB4 family ATPase
MGIEGLFIVKILVTILMFGLSSVILGFALTPRFARFFIPERRMTLLTEALPFSGMLDDKTILGKDGSLSQVLLIKGVTSIKTPHEIKTLLTRKQQWLDNLSQYGVAFKVITLRKEYEHQLELTNVPKVLTEIHEAWMAGFKKTYTNNHYLLLTVYPKKIDGFFKWFKKNEALSDVGLLQEIVSVSIETLNDFCLEVLSDTGDTSPLLSFLNELVTGETIPLRSSSQKERMANRLGSDGIEFHQNSEIISLYHYPKTQFAAIVSLNEIGENSSSDMLRQIESLPGRMVILHLCKGHQKLMAQEYLDYQRKQVQMFKKNAAVEAQFLYASELLGSEDASLYDYQSSIILFSEDKRYLAFLIEEAKRILRNFGVVPILEKGAKEHIWRTQFPGLDSMVRTTHPLSHNPAYLFNFESAPTGLDKCDWGMGAIRPFKTISGSAYALQLHISDAKEEIAHSLVIAPAGSGKTTLFQHLVGGALRHPNLRAFMFDRLNGTRIFTEASEGAYVDFSDDIVSINPLVCEDTLANKTFLQQFLLMLAKCEDDESKFNAAMAVKQIFRVPKEERLLKNVFNRISMKDSLFSKGLKKWVSIDAYAKWFNGAKVTESGLVAYDALDLAANRLVSFEMTDILSDPEVAAAMSLYIMHRIRLLSREAFPHFIFIDETQPMLRDPVFARQVDVLLKEHRKLRGAVALCFQTTEAINAAMLEQCQTRFLFPNAAAHKENYKMFDLSEFEWDYIKGVSRVSRDLRRSVLLKKPGESVILNIDMSGLGPLLQLYRSGSEPVKIMRELQQQWGQQDWVDRYVSL